MPNLLQMQSRVREAFKRDHGQKKNEGEGEGAPTLWEGRKESHCTRGKRQRGRRVLSRDPVGFTIIAYQGAGRGIMPRMRPGRHGAAREAKPQAS